MADRVTFTRPAAERIGKVVRIVEGGDREAAPYTVDVRMESQSQRAAVRFCSWTSTWTYGGVASVRFDPATNATATATNVILGVGPGDGWVARKGSAGWSLIGFDMTKQPGYSSGDVQLFGHTSGSTVIATWYSITSCATATASP